MFVERISASLVGSRIDASFYDPIYLEAENSIKKHNHTQLSKVTNFIKKGVFDMPSHLYGDTGIPFLRISDFDGLTVDIDNAIKIPRWKHEEEYKTKLIGGDIVISKVGTTGEIAKVPACCEVNVSQNLIAVSINHEKIDGDYLLALLKSDQLNKAIERHVTTIVQGKLTLDIIRELVIPLFVPHAQKYIGDKVRQAERLRAWAKAVQQQAAELLPAYINEIQRYEAKSYRAKDIIPERLDSLFYHPDYIALEGKMKAKGCKRLGLITKQIKDSWDKKKAEVFEYYEIGGLDITTGQVSSTKTQTVGAPSRAKTKVQQGDVLVSTVRPNRKNVGFIVDSVTDYEMVATSGFSVLRFSSLAQAAFYHAWLRTDDATAQLMRWNSGSAYPAIDDDVPLNIIIPDFEQTFVDSWGQKLLDAQFAYVFARRLTEVAKTLVEALIEGQLTEQQLIQAQQALEDGDNSLDQAILSKLTNEGYAIEDATPLFSDIDELYRLLESATQDEAGE
ncbi:restriction endonuclease subunit S [Vibrio fluvialis]|nr:restriction endonuclease subunit S [Vibrio fluvialis]